MTARLTGVVVGLIALVHVYWAFGGSAASAATVPLRDGQPTFSPGAAATLAVASGLLAVAIGILAAANGASWGRFLSFVAGLTFLGRAIGDFRLVGLFKQHREGAFARNDTLLYTPLCLVLSAGSFVAAATTREARP